MNTKNTIVHVLAAATGGCRPWPPVAAGGVSLTVTVRRGEEAQDRPYGPKIKDYIVTVSAPNGIPAAYAALIAQKAACPNRLTRHEYMARAAVEAASMSHYLAGYIERISHQEIDTAGGSEYEVYIRTIDPYND